MISSGSERKSCYSVADVAHFQQKQLPRSRFPYFGFFLSTLLWEPEFFFLPSSPHTTLVNWYLIECLLQPRSERDENKTANCWNKWGSISSRISLYLLNDVYLLWGSINISPPVITTITFCTYYSGKFRISIVTCNKGRDEQRKEKLFCSIFYALWTPQMDNILPTCDMKLGYLPGAEFCYKNYFVSALI